MKTFEQYLTEKYERRYEPLAKEMKKYDIFRFFSQDFSIHNMHGRYWHLTKDPNFKLNLKYKPTDYASGMGKGGESEFGGFMITSQPWHWGKSTKQLGKREYGVEVFIDDLISKKDYVISSRGFGQEVYINTSGLPKLKFGTVKTYEQIMKQARDWHRNLPQSEEKLLQIWNEVKGTKLTMFDVKKQDG